MSAKPTEIVQWALNSANETRQGGSNKIEPSSELQQNGSLDGNLSLNHFNWMMAATSLWQQFFSDMIETVDGVGTGLTKDDHYSYIVAFDKTNLADYVTGIAYKNGASAASTQIINNNTLTFGTPNADGTIPISGATAANVVAFSINLKLS